MLPAAYLALSLPITGGSSETPALVQQNFWSFVEPGTLVTRCERGSRDQPDARRAFERVRGRIEALDVSSDTSPMEPKAGGA